MFTRFCAQFKFLEKGCVETLSISLHERAFQFDSCSVLLLHAAALLRRAFTSLDRRALHATARPIPSTSLLRRALEYSARLCSRAVSLETRFSSPARRRPPFTPQRSTRVRHRHQSVSPPLLSNPSRASPQSLQNTRVDAPSLRRLKHSVTTPFPPSPVHSYTGQSNRAAIVVLRESFEFPSYTPPSSNSLRTQLIHHSTNLP